MEACVSGERWDGIREKKKQLIVIELEHYFEYLIFVKIVIDF